jgi:hypothetical protein
MRIFKNKAFAKFARKENISDEKLLKVIKEIEAGDFEADLGGNVFKQRISRPGEGKSGGYRAIIIFRQDDVAYFVFGFAKSVFSDIDDKDKRNFRDLAKIVLSRTPEQIETLLKEKALTEIKLKKKKPGGK